MNGNSFRSDHYCSCLNRRKTFGSHAINGFVQNFRCVKHKNSKMRHLFSKFLICAQYIPTKVHPLLQSILNTVHLWVQGFLNPFMSRVLPLMVLRYIYAPMVSYACCGEFSNTQELIKTQNWLSFSSKYKCYPSWLVALETFYDFCKMTRNEVLDIFNDGQRWYGM